MDVYLSERELIEILTCLSYTINRLKTNCTSTDRKELKLYFDLNNYDEIYSDLKLLFNRLSTNGNSKIYKKINDIYFVGFQKYLINLNYDFLCVEKEETKR